MIIINEKLAIPKREIRFTFSRSSDPGGQNVNKVSTRASLLFDVDRSLSLSLEHKARIRNRLTSRIRHKGILRITAGNQRSQKANRDAALKCFVRLLASALREKPPRKKTTVSKAAKEKRLQGKKHRSRIKQARSEKIKI
ncbi:MAG TPA: aminoacyl-tRNA hydrolase [Thermodesulfobacteriaceae bacterium]|nr:aminoacyl-tRNA hydrolase [Thermodesulfobacteriaceae bacterium]